MSSNRQQLKCANSTGAVLHALIMPVTTAVTTAVAKSAIELTRQLDSSDLKDNIKHRIAQVAGVVNVGVFAEALLPAASVWWKTYGLLTFKQKMMVGLTAAIGLASSVYSVSQFGQEQHVVAAGVGASTGSLFLKSSEAFATKFASDNVAHKHSLGLLDGESQTGLDSGATISLRRF